MAKIVYKESLINSKFEEVACPRSPESLDGSPDGLESMSIFSVRRCLLHLPLDLRQRSECLLWSQCSYSLLGPLIPQTFSLTHTYTKQLVTQYFYLQTWFSHHCPPFRPPGTPKSPCEVTPQCSHPLFPFALSPYSVVPIQLPYILLYPSPPDNVSLRAISAPVLGPGTVLGASARYQVNTYIFHLIGWEILLKPLMVLPICAEVLLTTSSH